MNTDFRAVMLGEIGGSVTWQNSKNGGFLDSCLAHCETMAVQGPGYVHFEVMLWG